MAKKIVETNTTEVMNNLDLHEMQIINQLNIAVQTIFEIGKLLKTIRDGKEYAARGFKSFQEYMDNDTAKPFKFKYTQGNKYISVYERYNPIQEQVKNVSLDVLYELMYIPNEDFERLKNENNLEAISVNEAKQLRKQLDEANEQISLLQSTVKESEDNSEEIESLKAEIERLKSEPVLTADDNAKKELAKVKKELKAKAKEEQDKAVREAIDKERKAIAKERKAEVDKATAELQNKIKKLQGKIESQYENMSEAVKKATELEEKLKAARTDNSQKFCLLFEQFQDNLENIFDALDAVKDKKTQRDFAEKLIKLGENIFNAAKEYC